MIFFQNYVNIFDPLSRPVVITIFTHVRSSVHNIQNLVKSNKFQMKIVIVTGETLSLAEGIIDNNTCFVIISFQVAVEWLTSLTFDAILIFAEMVINLWLGLLLKDQGDLGKFQAIIVFFFVPSIVNAIMWVKLSRYYTNIGFFFIMAVVFFGFPSPLFV